MHVVLTQAAAQEERMAVQNAKSAERNAESAVRLSTANFVQRGRLQAQKTGDAERNKTSMAQRENRNAFNEVIYNVFYLNGRIFVRLYDYTVTIL